MRVFDLHCDTISVLAENGSNLRNGETAVSLFRAEKMLGNAMKTDRGKGHPSAYVQCFALFSKEDDGAKGAALWDALYAVFSEQMRRFSDTILQANSYRGIQTAIEDGKNRSAKKSRMSCGGTDMEWQERIGRGSDVSGKRTFRLWERSGP